MNYTSPKFLAIVAAAVVAGVFIGQLKPVRDRLGKR